MKRLDSARHDFSVTLNANNATVQELLDVLHALGKVAGKTVKVYVETDDDKVKFSI